MRGEQTRRGEADGQIREGCCLSAPPSKANPLMYFTFIYHTKYTHRRTAKQRTETIMSSCKIDGNSGVSVHYARSVLDLDRYRYATCKYPAWPASYLDNSRAFSVLFYSTLLYLLYEGSRWPKGWLEGLAYSVDVGSSANGPPRNLPRSESESCP